MTYWIISVNCCDEIPGGDCELNGISFQFSKQIFFDNIIRDEQKFFRLRTVYYKNRSIKLRRSWFHSCRLLRGCMCTPVCGLCPSISVQCGLRQLQDETSDLRRALHDRGLPGEHCQIVGWPANVMDVETTSFPEWTKKLYFIQAIWTNVSNS